MNKSNTATDKKQQLYGQSVLHSANTALKVDCLENPKESDPGHYQHISPSTDTLQLTFEQKTATIGRVLTEK